MTPFVVHDCALLTRMSGSPPAFNLRELRDRILVCGEKVLYHHFCETTLRPTFDDPEYRNDFAVWAKEKLGDRVLAERLGIIDPYDYQKTEMLRQLVIEIIEDRLSELSPWVPSVHPGDEFFFMEAVTIAFATPYRIEHPDKLSKSIQLMTNGSIYYHFLEGLRRPPVHRDDFSAWLSQIGEEWSPYISAIESVDFYFKSLPSLRDDLVQALEQAMKGSR